MLIVIMLRYSAIKIRANLPALYSTLNPDTSSDSPSAKSKGVRFVSAKIELNHITMRGGQINIVQCENISADSEKLKVLMRTNALNRINAKEISYEMV